MISRIPRILALRHEAHGDTIRRALITLQAPPVAGVCGIQRILLSWWRSGGPYPVGKRFASWPETPA